jgi:hypothetical protein
MYFPLFLREFRRSLTLEDMMLHYSSSKCKKENMRYVKNNSLIPVLPISIASAANKKPKS